MQIFGTARDRTHDLGQVDALAAAVTLGHAHLGRAVRGGQGKRLLAGGFGNGRTGARAGDRVAGIHGDFTVGGGNGLGAFRGARFEWVHGLLPCLTDGLLPRAGLFGTGSRRTPHDGCLGSRPATRFPAEAATCTGEPTIRCLRLSGREQRATDPVCRQVFGLADADPAIHLVAVASRKLASSAWYGVRFHLPLRGSSGFAPDSLLTRLVRNRMANRRAPTRHKLLG